MYCISIWTFIYNIWSITVSSQTLQVITNFSTNAVIGDLQVGQTFDTSYGLHGLSNLSTLIQSPPNNVFRHIKHVLYKLILLINCRNIFQISQICQTQHYLLCINSYLVLTAICACRSIFTALIHILLSQNLKRLHLFCFCSCHLCVDLALEHFGHKVSGISFYKCLADAYKIITQLWVS
jgi:hypothetical protein